MRRLAVILALIASPLAAHEFWIEPQEYQIERDGRLRAQLVNGQNFDGVELSYLPQRFRFFMHFASDRAMPVEGRLGSKPALDVAPMGDGLQVIIYASSVARVGYDSVEKFQTFADHKDFADWAERHRALGLPEADFGEAYTRYAKTLIGVGTAQGADNRTNMETEFVAITNPYTANLNHGMQVQLWYRDAVRADTQVEMFEKSPSGDVAITLHRTDENGIATLPVKPGHSYLLDAVVLRQPNAELAAAQDVVWETLWASLTFEVPE